MSSGLGRLTLLVSLAVTAPGLADQCQVLTGEQVERATALVRPGSELLRLCEPCGETNPVPMQIREVESVAWEHGGGDLWELQVNTIALDAAYVFVPQGGSWHNLAAVIGCEATGVSPTIDWSWPSTSVSVADLPDELLVVDILDRSYDGTRFTRRWRARRELRLHERPATTSAETGRLATDEPVGVLAMESHVTPVTVHVVVDHGRFWKGDRFVLLDGLGEGFFHAWHRGELVTDDFTGLDVFQMRDPRQGCPEPSDECWGEAEGDPAERIWARVRTEDGREGWVEDPFAGFDGVMVGH